MSIKFKSFVVILSTAICVLFMLFPDRIQNSKDILKQNINLVINKDRSSSNDKKEGKEKGGDELDSNNIKNLSQFLITDKYKKFKMEALGEQISRDKVDFFYENISYNSQNDKSDSNMKIANEEIKKKNDKNSVTVKQDIKNKKKEEIAVFNYSEDGNMHSLTDSDKSKLMSVSSKLSVVDYQKVKEYLIKADNSDIRDVMKLLKERLSDKEYDKIRYIESKLASNETIEQ